MSRQLLLISTSTVHGSNYLDYCEDDIKTFLGDSTKVLFVPFARPGGISHDQYTNMARAKFEEMGMELVGVHESTDPPSAFDKTNAIFVGGGNTFVLLRELYRTGLMDEIRTRVSSGIPYMGSSAGSNVAGKTIGTTNDMPIVYPPSFDALGLVPFNINPHYLDADPNSKHRGETREVRIKEFHVIHDQPVVGLREGALLHVIGDEITLRGTTGARLFLTGEEPEEFAPGADMGFLLT